MNKDNNRIVLFWIQEKLKKFKYNLTILISYWIDKLRKVEPV